MTPGRKVNSEEKAAYMREWRKKNPERAKMIGDRSRVRNAKRNYDDARARFNAIKDGPCMDCGVWYPPYVMQWDHRDPATKEFTIGATARKAWGKVVAEVAKCDLVCANCHAIRTHERRKEQ